MFAINTCNSYKGIGFIERKKMSRIIIKDTNGKRKEIKFLHNVKCNHCHKWLDDYAYELTTKLQPNIKSNYCGGHTVQEVELSKKLKRGEAFLKNDKIYGSWTFSQGKF